MPFIKRGYIKRLAEKLDWLVVMSAELRRWDEEIQATIGLVASGRHLSRGHKVAFYKLLARRDALIARILKEYISGNRADDTEEAEQELRMAELERALAAQGFLRSEGNEKIQES